MKWKLLSLFVGTLAVAGLFLVAAPAQAGGCYANCELAYFKCVGSGQSGCDLQLSLCTLRCGGSGGGGGGGSDPRGRTPYDLCVLDCRIDFFDCVGAGVPVAVCTAAQNQCIDQCAAIYGVP
ncbi:MAG: hypothetical protein AAF604_21080 [Acidobacteriota bacterium]